MKIEVIAKYYHEEFLVPMFMLHYESWVDKFTFLTNKSPDNKHNDQLFLDWLHEAINRSDADWVIQLDMDEFIFPLPQGTDPRQALEQETGDYCWCKMFYMWRHATEIDLDRMKPPLLQRRHGSSEDHHKYSIMRPRKGLVLTPGCHEALGIAGMRRGKDWGGAHWQNADPAFAIDRRFRDRAQRTSDLNLSMGWGVHNFSKSRDQIESEMKQRTNEPLVIETVAERWR